MGTFLLPYPKQNKKPYVVRTSEGDYYFKTIEEAQCFAQKRNGFFDTNNRLYGRSRRRTGGGTKR